MYSKYPRARVAVLCLCTVNPAQIPSFEVTICSNTGNISGLTSRKRHGSLTSPYTQASGILPESSPQLNDGSDSFQASGNHWIKDVSITKERLESEVK